MNYLRVPVEPVVQANPPSIPFKSGQMQSYICSLSGDKAAEVQMDSHLAHCAWELVLGMRKAAMEAAYGVLT